MSSTITGSSAVAAAPLTSANSAPKGVELPQVLPLTTGTSTPGQSAMVSNQIQANNQTKMINALQGGKKKLTGGTSGQYSVPQFQMIYPCSGGPGQCPNDIIQSASGTGGQTFANQVYDGLVGQKAGTRICSSGQTKCWGCYSGGYKRKRTHKRRKSKNTRRTNKRKRTNKRRINKK